jgi:hypothetical protein
VSLDRAAFVAQVICLYLDDPDTPEVPSSADWDIARDLYDRGIPLETVRFAFQLAFARRHNRASGDSLPPVRSLAYFRTVALNLTSDERDPAYVRYIDDLYRRLRNPAPTPLPPNPTEIRAQQPDSRASS